MGTDHTGPAGIVVVEIRFVFVGAVRGKGRDGADEEQQGDAERKKASMVRNGRRRLRVFVGRPSCGCFAHCLLERPAKLYILLPCPYAAL